MINAERQNNTQLLVVYGSLKRGLHNAHWMRGCRFIGEDSLQSIVLYDLGPYPGARLDASEGVTVEIYTVTEEQLRHIDVLEDYKAADPASGLYDRVLVSTRFGKAWVYIYNRAVDGFPAIRRGGWMPDPARQYVSEPEPGT